MVKKTAFKTYSYIDTCSPIDGTIVVQCKTEREVLLEAKFIHKLDPDIMMVIISLALIIHICITELLN